NSRSRLRSMSLICMILISLRRFIVLIDDEIAPRLRLDLDRVRRKLKPNADEIWQFGRQDFGSFVRAGNRVPAPGPRPDLPWRGHPGDHQGAAAVRRRLCRWLSGRARVAPAGRDG